MAWFITIICLIIFSSVIIYLLTIEYRNRPYIAPEHHGWKKNMPQGGSSPFYTLFLIGDAGAPSILHPDPTLTLLKRKLEEAGEHSGVFFLGDNIYPAGLPEPDDKDFPIAEKRLLAQLRVVEQHKGIKVFISGNHDWKKGKKGGFQTMMRQQEYVENYLNSKEVFLPRNGCPGPFELSISDQLTIIVLNTQWWVHGGHKPRGKREGCVVDNEHEFFVLLEELLFRNRFKRIVVVGHHPLYSFAIHGGRFTMKQHLFPLTSAHKHLYVPLPVAGSLYPIYRRYIGSKEDMSHPLYKRLRRRLIDIFKEYDNLIYAAGHDHNLQYIYKNNQHYIVSGAGSKVDYVQKNSNAVFTHAHKGFFKLSFYEKETWLEVLEPHTLMESGVVAFRKRMF
jgi:hypothetical protein